MAMWEENLADARPLSCLRAAQCAMELQGKLDQYEAHGSTLSIKISLGYGKLVAFHVGGIRGKWEYFIGGAPLLQVTLAEHQAKAGDIVLSNESWKMVMDQCEGSVLSSGDVKLKSVRHPIPRRQAPPLRLDPSVKAALAAYIPSSILNKMGDFATTWSRGRKESGNTAEQWASDLRTISTIFTCLAVEGEGGAESDGSAERDLELYGQLFRSMQKRVYSYDGTIRQFLVDDKGMVLIACYGLVAHENDAERATRCAMDIAKDLTKMRITSSSGVTTGEVYCGLVGGDTRCEYALIGDKVNMAARLMASTPDEIRCDLETYNRSCRRISYEKLDPIKVKGKEKKIEVFKPVGGSVSTALTLRQVPLIGRDEEILLVSRNIDAFDDLAYSAAIIIQGEAGMGKSKLLEEAIKCIEGHKLSMTPRNGQFEAMSTDRSLSFIAAILSEQWNLDPAQSKDARTNIVRTAVKSIAVPFAMKHIGLLGHVIPNLDFRKNSVASMPPASLFSILVRMVSGFLVAGVRKGKTVILCDNAHCLDLQSWKALRAVFKSLPKNMLLILAQRTLIKSETVKKISAWFIASNCALCLELGSLSAADSAALTCAVFQVTSIPRALAAAIYGKFRSGRRSILIISFLNDS